MLSELRIRQFAIIESLALPLVAGFNVLTGETGAGKSIIVGALGFLLGERTGADVIRTGADRATVEGVFDPDARPEIAALCEERGIPLDGDALILRREIARTGRSRAWINDTATTVGTLADLGRLLVSLHGQHEAQTLIDPESQRRILDEFGGAGIAAAAVRAAADEHAELVRQIEALSTRRAEVERRADYLRHVAAEIEAAALREGEEERIEDEARRLEHADELRHIAAEAASAMDGDDEAVLPRLAALARSLRRLEHIDPAAAPLREMLDGAYYTLEELARDVAAYGQGIDLDPGRLADVQRRRDVLFRLTKKYGPTVGEVIEAGRRAREELDLLETGHLDLRQLQARLAGAASTLDRAAAELSRLRRAAGERLAREVDAVLPDLGMDDGHFTVALLPREGIAATGAEDVEFRVALNVGHEARPLARVASGGELSRVMLALKTIVARLDHTPTLVFDEVDAGIGGRVGLQIGDTMRRVAADHQVLAISHLPQLAARAHHHIVVTKGAREGITAADTRTVDGSARVEEVARMLGGDPESGVSLAHARELLEVAAPAPPRRARKR